MICFYQPQHLCVELVGGGTNNSTITSARCRDLTKSPDTTDGYVNVEAEHFIVAAGAVLTPQLLWKSNIRPMALGKHLCEQPKTFCQIVLKERFIKQLRKHKFPGLTDEMNKKISEHEYDHPHDPIPIPFTDKAPQVRATSLPGV